MTGPTNTLFRVLTALASIAAGVLHWEIWAHHGYRSTPIREMFIASAVTGVAVGAVALIGRPRAAALAVVANIGFLAAFVLSRVSEVPTFHGPWSEMGLAPNDATLLGVSTTLVLLIAEGAAVVFGLASLAFSRGPRSVPLPSAVARA